MVKFIEMITCLEIYEIQIGEDFISVSISNLTPDMSCSAHVCSTGLMTSVISFHSRVQRSNKSILILVN